MLITPYHTVYAQDKDVLIENFEYLKKLAQAHLYLPGTYLVSDCIEEDIMEYIFNLLGTYSIYCMELHITSESYRTLSSEQRQRYQSFLKVFEHNAEDFIDNDDYYSMGFCLKHPYVQFLGEYLQNKNCGFIKSYFGSCLCKAWHNISWTSDYSNFDFYFENIDHIYTLYLLFEGYLGNAEFVVWILKSLRYLQLLNQLLNPVYKKGGLCYEPSAYMVH